MAKKKPPELSSDLKTPIWARNAEGEPICGYTRKGKVCHQTILDPETGRCVAGGHGGRATHTGRPLETGEYSKYRGVLRITDRAEQLEKDPNLAAHRKAIADMDALAEILLEGYEPTLPMWKGMEARWSECIGLFNRLKSGDAEAAKPLFVGLRSGLDDSKRAGVHASQVAQFIAIRDESRKHRVAENRREGTLEANLNAKEANVLGNRIVAILLARVGRTLDQDCLREIGIDIAREFGPSDRERAQLN